MVTMLGPDAEIESTITPYTCDTFLVAMIDPQTPFLVALLYNEQKPEHKNTWSDERFSRIIWMNLTDRYFIGLHEAADITFTERKFATTPKSPLR